MVSGEFFGWKDNFRSQKVLVVAKYSGQNVALQENFKLSDFSLGSVPALEVKSANGDKKFLEKSAAIAYFFADENLKGGKNELNQAEVLQWLFWGEEDLLPAIFNHVFPILGLMPAKKNEKSEIFPVLEKLNKVLKLKTFLVGERISLADISLSLNLVLLFERGLLKEDREKFPYLLRWFETIIHQKNVQDVIGEIKFCQQLKSLDPEQVQAKGF